MNECFKRKQFFQLHVLVLQAWIYYYIFFILSGGLGGNLSVVCGSNHSAETTSMESSTTTASSTARLISTTTEVSSVELITTSAINENISDATGSTAATLSEENKCDSLIGRLFFEYMISENPNLLIIVNFTKKVSFKLLSNAISTCRTCRIRKIP